MVQRARLVWKGPQFTAQLKEAVQEGMEKSARKLRDLCRDAVSKPYPPASTPGEPPHLRTGTGRSSIMHADSPRKQESYVFVTDEGRHMIFLENGTARIAPRPWLKPTFAKNKKRLRAIMEAPIKKMLK